MYGLIATIRATPGQRETLIAILQHGVVDMPGCLSYVVAKDSRDADQIWITEVWADASDHKASLALPSVREAIAQARPLIASMERVAETTPVGGVGI